jgi:hypothetical protein
MISPRLAGSAAALSLVTLLGSGCATPTAPPPPDVALSAPTRAAGPAAEPVKDTPLTPGTRYRFADVLPGLLDVELTAPDPQLYSTFNPTLATLTPDAAHATDGVAFMAAFAMRVQRDPYTPGDQFASDADWYRLSTPAPPDLFGYLTGLPFVDSTPPTPVTVGGVEGRAIDLHIRDMPAQAAGCEIDSVPRCATLLMMPGFGFNAVPGQNLRFITLTAPGGDLVVEQNLDVPSAQTTLDSVAFVERPAPEGFPGAHPMPFGGVLAAGTQYAVPVPDAPGAGATFTVFGPPVRGVASSPDLTIFSADRQTLRQAVWSAENVHIPDPGVDPVLVGPGAVENSPAVEPGVVDWLVAQPWAQVVTPPSTGEVGGLPARTVEIRATGAGPTIACSPVDPAAGQCAGVLFNIIDGMTIRLAPTNVLKAAEVTAGNRPVVVLTVGEDPTAGTLRFTAPS